MTFQAQEQEVLETTVTYRFIKVNGTMVKVEIQNADDAFAAAINVRSSRKKAVAKELFIHGVTHKY
ncbi:hypothetical protein VT25_03575 [Photobacterium leiognathi subsp. mandapamensis]|jgi:hypothetical protein|nr:hypothetical protein VT25_03575 [Photobacterium leiognathi subsp. mandapamensis]